MNTNSLRINNEIQIFNYFSRSIDINLCKNLICEILSLNNYLGLNKKFISFEINTPDDFLLNDQIKIIFNSDYDINIFLYNLAEDKYLRVEKKVSDLELINVTRNEFLSCEFESLSLISSDLLICKELLLKLFSKTHLSNFAQLTENIYTLPTSYFLNMFNNKEDFIGRIKLLDIDTVSKKNFKFNLDNTNSIKLADKANFSKRIYKSKKTSLTKSQFYIAWPKDQDKFTKKLLLNKILLDADLDFKDIARKINLDEVIPNSVIRNFDQNAIIFDENSFKGNSSKYPEVFSFHLKPNKIQPKHLHAYLNHGGGGNDVIEAIIKSLNLNYSFAEDFEDLKDGIPIVWGVLRNSKSIIDYAKKLVNIFIILIMLISIEVINFHTE